MAEAVETAKKPFSWGARRAILITIGIYLLTQLAAVLVFSLYAMLQNWTSAEANQWLDSSVIAQFAFIVVVEAGTLGLLYLFIRRYKTSFKNLGLIKPKLRDVGYALSGFAVYLPLYLATLAAVHALVPSINIDQKQQLGFQDANGNMLFVVFMGLVILAPITEEILVRGFLYGSLKKQWPKIYAVICTSVLFAMAHLQFGSGAPLLWVAAIDTFILSLVLIYLRDKTGGLAASIMLHMLKNSLAFIALFIIRAG
jgi:membrane protease YdiL (CAAX protease family)